MLSMGVYRGERVNEHTQSFLGLPHFPIRLS
jgi:hypothetical protein